jgi:hypothetical protein
LHSDFKTAKDACIKAQNSHSDAVAVAVPADAIAFPG